MHRFIAFLALLIVLPSFAVESPSVGKVTGSVVDQATKPIEYAIVAVKSRADGKVLHSGATDAKGRFQIDNIPAGEFLLVYGLVGAEQLESPAFTIGASARAVDLGRLIVVRDAAVKLGKVEVSARKETLYNAIDRKIYNVGQDIRSATGSASDLLKNVPSVQVDIEGNVSLRGDSNVLILVNGKTSTVMGRNRAAVLEQMPADGIEKIEVITNPSAKYKPDGTAGIINLTLKKKQDAGYSGSVRGSVGNDGRYNGSVTANYNPGKYNFFGSAAVRQDNRPRTVQDDRSHVDAATNSLVSTSQHTTEDSRPLSRIAQAGIDYRLREQTKIGGHVNYNYRDFVRDSVVTNLSRNAAGLVTTDYDRLRRDPEFEEDLEFTGTVQHTFPTEDHELSIELRRGRTSEQEDNRYTNVYRVPARVAVRENVLIQKAETNTEATADYARPLGDHAKLETGYSGQANTTDMNYRGSVFDPVTNLWRVDAARTNHFVYDAKIHAVYATYAHKSDKVGVLGGLRFEQAKIATDQVTARLANENSYARFYPSVHLTYSLTETQQLQLNYSHRVRRPEGDDLNPFPEFQDPFNLRAGNPRLVPEDIHSLESGWQYRKDDTTYLATVYYRQRYRGVTEVSRYIDATTLLTTKENLGTSRSGGLELGATTLIRDRIALNFSANVYRNEIDASNLGFSTRRATIALDAKLNASWDVSKATLVQLNANYTAKRLTPQGYRYPTHIVNLGLRHNFKDRRIVAVVSLSDVFNSLRERTRIETPVLRQDIERRRSSRILYVGFIYHFGRPPKKAKDDLQFDATL
ncbi:MAG: TonB-dependent receptor [Opitutaceae bacterium]|nr:TonB-dependent receptor [Opitutaceae bacterium]